MLLAFVGVIISFLDFIWVKAYLKAGNSIAEAICGTVLVFLLVVTVLWILAVFTKEGGD